MGQAWVYFIRLNSVKRLLKQVIYTWVITWVSMGLPVQTALAEGGTHAVRPLKVVVTLPPLGSMISPILQQSDQLKVILNLGAEAHGYQLKPSDVRAIEQADVILALGNAADSWAHKAILNSGKPVIWMATLPGIQHLPLKGGGGQHSSDEHDHHMEDGHDHDMKATPELADKMQDPHIWLSLANAQKMVRAFMAFQLKQSQTVASEMAKKHQAWWFRLSNLAPKLREELVQVKARPFVVLHSGYAYFEHDYQLNNQGSIQLSESIAPSMKHIVELQHLMAEKQIKCVVKAPQFPAKQVDYVVRDLKGVKVVSIDPLTVRAPNGQAKLVDYDVFLLTMAKGFKGCLTYN